MEEENKENILKPLSYNMNVQGLRKGIPEGYCRICGKFSKLTSDHIPPQSCGNKSRVKFTVQGKTLIFQNGFNCRTICEKCNNKILGSSCDKTFNELYMKVHDFQRSNICLPNGFLKIEIDVREIVRCILGHFIAANVCGEAPVSEILLRPIDEQIFDNYRKFVLQETDNLGNTDIYYWFYPFSDIRIIPYYTLATGFLGGKKLFAYGTLIKFYPIALFFENMTNSNCKLRLPKLELTSGLLSLNIENTIPKDYLEKPFAKDSILFMRSSSVIQSK